MIFKNNDVAFAIIATCKLSKYCIKTLEMDDKNFSNQILQGFTATDGEQKPCDNVNPNQDTRIEPTFDTPLESKESIDSQDKFFASKDKGEESIQQDNSAPYTEPKAEQ